MKNSIVFLNNIRIFGEQLKQIEIMKTTLSSNEIALSKIINAGYDFKRVNQHAVKIYKDGIFKATFVKTEKGMYENASTYFNL